MATPEPNNNEARIQEQPLDHFMEEAYRRYAVLTILDRALPDARDGLKPVQRRILYAMADMNLNSNTPHRKSARVVGEVLGKYHPHGDQSVYDAMVRMAQDFSMRFPLIDGQGNYGSIDGDSAAAMRYTEARLTAFGEAMLADLEKDTVNWRPNFDGSLKEPIVLPARFPNLLINGTTGIAVGMSTNILPHNLGEVCDAVMHIARNWKKRELITTAELMKFIPGPDLPTGGLLYRYRVNGDDKKVDMIYRAYETGNATMVCQAKADILDIPGGKAEIIITELPYQTQKTTILERIASNRDKFAGITDVRDESDYKGMRVVFEVARGTSPQDVLERLLTHTQMRASLSYNALALVQGGPEGKPTPKNLRLLDMLVEFIMHRLVVIVRRSKYELARSEARLHILEGLLKALSMIDEVIDIIRHSQTPETAKTNLMKKLELSDIQAQAILDMPLRRLASLERKKLDDESKELRARVKELKDILGSEARRLEVVVNETDEVKTRFANRRRTVIVEAEEGHQAVVTVADLMTPTETQLVLITATDLQRVNAKGYRESITAGKPTSKAVEVTLSKTIAEATLPLMLISSKGRLWQGNVGRLPLQGDFKTLGLAAGEKVVGCVPATAGQKLILVTRSGNIKRVNVEDCLASRTEATWAPIISLENDKDEVLMADLASDNAHVIITTSGSAQTTPRSLRFEVGSINTQATPSARGVGGIKVLDDQLVASVIIEPKQFKGFALIITSRGHLKKVSLEEFPVQGRGGQGVQIWKPNEATGFVSGFTIAANADSVDIVSPRSKRIRLQVKELSQAGRATKGVDLGARYGGGDLFGGEEAQVIITV